MSDLINRQDAIKAIEDLPNAYNGWSDAYDKAYIICTLEEVPSAQKRGEWIPCSERLPEKSGKYLVTVRNGNVYAGTYSAYEGRFQCAAVAWMELPEPYQEEFLWQ